MIPMPTCVLLWHPAAVPLPCRGLSGPSVGVGKALAATSAYWLYPSLGHRWRRGTSTGQTHAQNVYTYTDMHMHSYAYKTFSKRTCRHSEGCDHSCWNKHCWDCYGNVFCVKYILILHDEYLRQHFLIWCNLIYLNAFLPTYTHKPIPQSCAVIAHWAAILW